MSKRLILIAAGVLVISILGVWGINTWVAGKSSPIIPIVETITGKLKIEGEEVYQDESGFSFKYPKNTDVTDRTPDEGDYYSLLEITSKETGGALTIEIRDTEVTSVAKWVSQNLAEAQLTGATSLGKMEATQYSATQGGQKQLVTLAIDQGVIFKLAGPADGGFWEEVQELITSSFVFGLARGEQTSPTESIIYEEEEVVE